MVSLTSRRRLLLAAAPALLCGLAFGAPANSAAQGTTPWGVATNDVKPDPAIRYGRLPNGMKYAIVVRKNHSHLYPRNSERLVSCAARP